MRKGERGGAMFTPRNLFLRLGVLHLCQFWWKSIKKCERESARRRTHGQRQTGLTICPMLYAIAMGQIIIFLWTDNPTLARDVFVDSWRRRRRTQKSRCCCRSPTVWCLCRIGWLTLHSAAPHRSVGLWCTCELISMSGFPGSKMRPEFTMKRSCCRHFLLLQLPQRLFDVLGTIVVNGLLLPAMLKSSGDDR